MSSHTGGTFSYSGRMDYPRIPIAEMHLGKCLDSMEFQSWKLNFRNEVCMRTAEPQITMHWIKEVEIAKSIDELMTSRPVVRRDFTDFDMLDAMIASGLKKLLTSVHKKRASIEEQRAQKHDRFLRGRQVAYLFYEYFSATGAYEAVQGHKDLFTLKLQSDDVQDFDVRWDQALLSVSEMTCEVILEGLSKSKLQDSAQHQTVLALYDQESARNKRKPNYSQLKTAVKNSKLQGSERWEKDQLPRVKKGNEVCVERNVESVFSGRSTWAMFQKKISVVSVMTSEPRSSCPASHSKAKQTDGKVGKTLTRIKR